MIEVRNLSKSFGKKPVLKEISLSLDHGVYGLLGPNGAGKTTLIRCLTGLYDIRKGTVFLDGRDVLELKSFSASLGYLPQKFGLLKGLTASEMLQYFAESRHLPRQGQQEEIARCLEAVGLSDRADDKIRTLSGGMIRRLGVAQAILGDPELVILDEPTAGLDPEERLRFKNMISAMTRDKTIILSTHIVEDVVMLCDHIIVLAKGEIAAAGSVDEIASLAEGHVYEVPPDREGELTAPYFVSQREEHRLRVLSGVAQPGRLREPRVEDGYLCVVKELL